MRIVLDTNILVRANPKVAPAGLARDLLLTIVSANEHTLILSSAILVEVRRVLNYPHLQSRWPLTEEMIAQYADVLCTRDLDFAHDLVRKSLPRVRHPSSG